jgi:hypothetical protein
MHFCVTVVGEDISGQLEPYRERTENDQIVGEWDYYIVGGRYSRLLRLKRNANLDLCYVGGIIDLLSDGMMPLSKVMELDFAHMRHFKSVAHFERFKYSCDSALLKDIDVAAIRQESVDEATRAHNLAHSIINGREFKTFEQCLAEYGENSIAANEYNSQAVVSDFLQATLKLMESSDFTLSLMDRPDSFMVPIEEYTTAVGNGALSTFTILKDGKWTQRDYDQPKAEWDAEFGKLYSSLQGDVRITIVDCHV